MQTYIKEINKIRNDYLKRLQSIDELTIIQPNGAMYFFIQINKNINSWTLAKKLIQQHHVITIPGSVFYAPYPSLRISFGNLRWNESQIGINRLTKGLNQLLS